MKQRFLGAAILLLVCTPPLLMGGRLLEVFLFVIGLAASYEFTSIRNKKFNVVIYLFMVCYIASINFFPAFQVGIILTSIIVLFALGVWLEDITLDDISSTFMMGTILAFAISCVARIYDVSSFCVMFYIAFASFGCDIGAYFIGMFFGKHKLNPRVSPKKTVEGSIGGWAFGALASFIFAWIFHFFGYSIGFIMFYSLTLPIIAQLGDLSFSLIKRNYGVKDYGSIIPGHGGVLDRIDSLLFCLIFFASTTPFVHILIG